MSLTIGVLAVQGAFREHIAVLRSINVNAKEARQFKDLSGIDGLIIPGGESTTIGKLLNELGMLEHLKMRISNGMPVYGTCAGLILLCREIENSSQPRIGLLDATVRRNAFGRQVDSFEKELDIPVLGYPPFMSVFIRAPVILNIGKNVEILAEINQDGQKRAVAVRQKNILATSFHPELTGDSRLHKYFISMC